MEGTYPFIIGGTRQGTLKVGPMGGYTLFSLDCDMQPEVIRVSVYGDGLEGYLGVPIPRDGRLWLEKKLSPAAMAVFPEKIDHAGLAGESQPRREPEPQLPARSEPEPEAAAKPCAQPEQTKPQPEETGVIWYSAADGALVGRDAERDYVALLPGDSRIPPDYPAEQRIIEGKEYLVYISQERKPSSD